MARIAFGAFEDLVAFQSMGEGMWANARDENEQDKAEKLNRLMDALTVLDPDAGVRATDFPGDLFETAQAVIQEIRDNDDPILVEFTLA